MSNWSNFLPSLAMTLLSSLVVLLFCLTRQGTSGSITPIDGEIDWVKRYQEPTVIQCISTNPEAKLHWFRGDVELESNNEKYTIHNDNGTLAINRAGKDDLGLYVCQESDDTKANVTLYAAPFGRSVKSININKGNQLELECDAWGNPNPSITWYVNNTKVVPSDNRILLKNTTLDNGQLVITSLEMTDYNVYQCSASNGYGTYNITTLVRVKTPLAALWPILGIAIQMAILGVIIFFYERRKKKMLTVEKKREEDFNKARQVNTGRNDDIRKRLSN